MTTPPIPACCGCSTAKRLWKSKAGAAGKACADCHDDARASMKGVAARYPAFDKALGRPVNLEQRINLCRARHKQATPFALRKPRPAGADRLRRRAVARRARLRPAPIPNWRRSSPGGATSSCSVRASSISAAPIATTTIGTSTSPAPPITPGASRPAIRSTGWNGNRSARCSAACATASPASAPRPYDYGAPELVELELYLMSRARGMPIETPAVRP